MKWFRTIGPFGGKWHIEEQEDVKPEDDKWIYFKAPDEWPYGLNDGSDGCPSIQEVYPDGVCKVSKVYIGFDYFRTREEAEEAILKHNRRFKPLVEPSDTERSTWSDVTREYVEDLEFFYDEKKKR